MSESSIVIRRGLPNRLRDAGAELFDDAFGDKMGMAVPNRDRRLAFMARAFSASHVVVALRSDELVGMVGLSSREGAFRGGLMDIPWDPRPYRELLGLAGSLRASLGLRLADHRPEVGELYIDGVAVASHARGQGIGTRLLDEAVAVAREHGLRWVRLDVVDINPRAQQLYERLGYKTIRVQTFRYMRRFIGFGGMTSMELEVDGADASASGE